MNEVSNIVYSPADYEKAAVIATEAGNELLARLDWMTIEPTLIVDVNCRAGELSRGLQKRYPNATVLASDDIQVMAAYTSEFHRPVICAQANKLPLLPHSVDMLLAHLVLPFQSDAEAIKKLLQEWRRVLKPEGLLIFTALGVDTLQQLRGIIQPEQGPLLFDMHNGGDMLVQAGFLDPVLDVDYYTLSYDNPAKLWVEMQASGMVQGEVADEVKFKLTCAEEGDYEVTFEVVHAHAFAPQISTGYKPSADGVTRIPLSHLRRTQR